MWPEIGAGVNDLPPHSHPPQKQKQNESGWCDKLSVLLVSIYSVFVDINTLNTQKQSKIMFWLVSLTRFPAQDRNPCFDLWNRSEWPGRKALGRSHCNPWVPKMGCINGYPNWIQNDPNTTDIWMNFDDIIIHYLLPSLMIFDDIWEPVKELYVHNETMLFSLSTELSW